MKEIDKSKFNILIVDDIPKNIQLLGSILKQEGYTVSFATNGNQALSMVENYEFDLILLDVMMPDMNGFEVCEQLKNNPKVKDVPVIFLTAKTEIESVIKGFELGAVDYITKPFNAKELLARVKTHTLLRHTEKELREANATKDKFFSIIAHDLKNPFNSLLNVSSLLFKKFDSYEDGKKKKYIRDIYDASLRAYRLLENLLQWAQTQRGQIKVKKEKIDLFKIIQDVIPLIEDSAKIKNISISESVLPNTIVYADANMVSTVIRNLLSNAVKFTKSEGRIKITCKTIDNIEEVCIEDTGVGMNQEEISRLFRIDVHHSTIGTANERGTGLGLILCKDFIEQHGGTICVESECGLGSKFKFILPKNC
ncbi:MAG: hybrid sensor histidine kinase/response regulator [Desulfobacterales bacterium]|nr:hybrid sensor histidine kinase/response regulator [Desulfobacterales bacterium]